MRFPAIFFFLGLGGEALVLSDLRTKSFICGTLAYLGMFIKCCVYFLFLFYTPNFWGSFSLPPLTMFRE